MQVPGDAGNRPLHLAASSGNAKVVFNLIMSGASVNSLNDYGNKPRHLTKDAQCSKMLKRLEEGGEAARLQLKKEQDEIERKNQIALEERMKAEEEKERMRLEFEAEAVRRRQEEDAEEARQEEEERERIRAEEEAKAAWLAKQNWPRSGQ